jgi:hypothetical protein
VPVLVEAGAGADSASVTVAVAVSVSVSVSVSVEPAAAPTTAVGSESSETVAEAGSPPGLATIGEVGRALELAAVLVSWGEEAAGSEEPEESEPLPRLLTGGPGKV